MSIQYQRAANDGDHSWSPVDHRKDKNMFDSVVIKFQVFHKNLFGVEFDLDLDYTCLLT